MNQFDFQEKSMTTSTNIITFHGHDLVTVEIDGHPYVAMKPICDAIGLSWQGQLESVKRDPILSTCIRVTRIQLPGDSQFREVICLPLSKLNGWLFKITPSRIKQELREQVIDYQRNCYDLLYEHFHGRAALQHKKYWLDKNQHWIDILPLALQGLKNIEIAEQLALSPGRVARAIKRMIEVGLLDPVARIRARYKQATAERMVQLPLCAEWGV